MTYIGYDYENRVISVVSARSIELASAFWQGKGLPINSHKCLEKDFMSLDEHPTGVFEYVKTKEITDYNLSESCRNPKGRIFIIIVA